MKKIIVVFYLDEEDIEWSPWKSCIRSDGNLCRCQARQCQNRRNSSCEGAYEFRLANCTGEKLLNLSSLSIFKMPSSAYPSSEAAWSSKTLLGASEYPLCAFLS